MLASSFVLVQSTQAQSFNVIHNFTGGTDGGNPLNGLVLGAGGYMYGTTSAGGAYNNGTVFRLAPTGILTTIYAFKGGADGSTPQSFLIQDSQGLLYGTTSAGGAYGGGTVFRIANNSKSILHSFGSGSDGSVPLGGLVLDHAGNLYGTTSAGGVNGNGAVFMLSLSGILWRESVLYSFGTGTDGAVPYAGVTLDSSGDVLGTTSAGGTGGYGTIFELNKQHSWAESVVYNFQNQNDGGVPYAGLIADGLGNFYGAATEGGSQGGGSIFELTPAGSGWNFTAIQSLAGWGISGTFRNLLLSSSGTLYATTHCDGEYDAGTVYELVPGVGGTWTYTQLYTFTGGTDGLYSFSNLVTFGNRFYGTTNQGGAYGYGDVFAVFP
ncbi:MAG: choice-of-anchor tandem repeat GloVer-containing protein [Candidatus Korobacteraceae bacterium]